MLAARQPAADDLVRALSARRALFGVHRMTPTRLLGVLCAERLFRDGLAPAAGLGAEAVAARAIYKLAAAGALGYFAPVADRPGFPGALARTLGEVRLAGIGARRVGGAGGDRRAARRDAAPVRDRASRRAPGRPRGDARAGGCDRQRRSAATPRHDADPDARRRGRLDARARIVRGARRARARDARDRAGGRHDHARDARHGSRRHAGPRAPCSRDGGIDRAASGLSVQRREASRAPARRYG